MVGERRMERQETVGIILAYKKPMSVYGSISAVRRLTLAVRKAGINPIIFVTGKQAYDVERSMADFGAIFIQKEGTGKSSEADYIKLGLEVALRLYKRAVITSTEYPVLHPDTIKEVLEKQGDVVMTQKSGKYCFPIKLEREAMLQTFEGCSTGLFLDWILSANLNHVSVETKDPGVRAKKESSNITELVTNHNKMLLQPYVLAFMETEKHFFDKRIMLLLKLIDEFSSVKQACKHMAMSYAKAWETLNYMENILGYQVVNRNHGGRKGGNTQLTPEGKRLVLLFEEYEMRVKAYSRECFTEIFPEFWNNCSK